MGVVLHAVQDFYAHTNWVMIASVYGAGNLLGAQSLPCWEDIYDPPTAAAWTAAHPTFRVAAFKAALADGTARSTEFAAAALGGKPRPHLQSGNWPNGTPRASVGLTPWGHRHPGSRSAADRASIRAYFGTPTSPVSEGTAALALAKRCGNWWIDFMTGAGVLGAAATTDLATFVGTSTGSLDPPTEDAIALVNLRDVIVDLTGVLEDEERVNFAVGGDLPTALTIEDGRPTEGSIDTAFGDPTLNAWAADDTIWPTILAASDAVGLARQYVSNGLLSLSRPEAVGGTTQLLVGGDEPSSHSSGSSPRDNAVPIAGAAAAAALLTLVTGGWYVRRRWQR